MSETREILYGTVYENRPIVAFHPLKELPPNTEIAGKHLGRRESKKTEGCFFHLFEHDNGEVHAYGTCKVLDERVEQFHAKAQELGQDPKEVCMSTRFLGRLKNKNNTNTSYKFTQVVIYKPSSTTQAQATTPTETAVTNEEIPF